MAPFAQVPITEKVHRSNPVGREASARSCAQSNERNSNTIKTAAGAGDDISASPTTADSAQTSFPVSGQITGPIAGGIGVRDQVSDAELRNIRDLLGADT